MVFFPKLPTTLWKLRQDKLRYAQKIIPGILGICLWLFFSHAFRLRLISYAGQVILNKNPHFWTDTNLVFVKKSGQDPFQSLPL